MKLDDNFKLYDITIRRAMEMYIEMVIFFGREMEKENLSEKDLIGFARKIAKTQGEFGFLCNINGRVTERYDTIRKGGPDECFFSSCNDIYKLFDGDEEKLRSILRSKISEDLEKKEEEDYSFDENY